ncbi:hypothetical protein AWV79_15115 [Cupriavidus sp. UYMMa02A]|nr:hypothetical protein AWV79_15115 [Cupriavidus sp. UYMMa02A]
MWLYPILNAAYAYSFHWFAIFAIFLIAYSKLFRIAGASNVEALLLTLSLYLTGFTQFWWSEKGPILSLFAMALTVLFVQLPIWLRLTLFYWLATSWLVTNFYPPVVISLAFVGAIFFFCHGKEWFQPKRLIALIVVAMLSAGTCALYLRDYLTKTVTTFYPGHRNLDGGTLSFDLWLSQFLPASTFDSKYNSLVGANISEIGVVGTWIFLICACFVNYKNIPGTLRQYPERKRELLILGIGLAVMTAWMLLPVPAILGKVLLWNNVQPERMVYAAGFLLLLFCFALLKRIGIIWSTSRAIIFLSIVVGSWLLTKGMKFGFKAKYDADLYVVPLISLLIPLRQFMRTHPLVAVLAASTMASAIVFLPFNPIQSAWPIFNLPETEMRQKLDLEASRNGNVLAIEGFAGATLNGLGYKSVSHVTAVPAMEYWHFRLQQSPPEEVDRIFNRYSHISLIDADLPQLLGPDHVAFRSVFFINQLLCIANNLPRSELQ